MPVTAEDLFSYSVPVSSNEDDSVLFHHVDAQSDQNKTVLTTFSHYRHLVDILKALGHEDWRTGQLPAITALCENIDVCCALPPGSGKTLIFQVAGLYKAMTGKGITFIITPLISLMKDQIDQLLDKGIYAIPLYHSQDSAIYKQAINELKNSSHPPAFVYLTPERFSLPEWVELTDHLYQSGRLGLVVIDEAQVVLEWGPDYRPLYMELRDLKKRVPNIPILALSGSMSPIKLKSYVKYMGIQGCQLISKHPDRPNIYYDIIPMDDKGMDAEIVKYVKRQSPTFSGIIYCRTPRHCNVLQKRLKKAGIFSVLYTGQMAQEKKTMSYQLWKHNFCYLMLATISFGMGIDKEDVRYILHRDLPKDLSAYIQETGRAGRDGGPAKCVLFYRFTDCHKNYALATRDHSSEKRLDLLKQEIIPPSQELLKMCSSLTTCRRAHILAHYDIPPPPEPCKNCDVCCHPYQDRNVARVKKTFVCRLVKFFTGKKEENEEHISISNLTEGFAKEVPFHPFKTLLGLDDEQDAKAKSTNGRTRITARVVQNLILQGLFTEYPHQASPENINFYLKLGKEVEELEEFVVLL